MVSKAVESFVIYSRTVRRIVANDIKKNIGKIEMIIKMIIPVLTVYFNLGYVGSMFLFCSVMFLSWSVSEIDRIYNHKTKADIPLPPKALTEVEDGLITIKNEDMQDAILYLHAVEGYLKDKGYL